MSGTATASAPVAKKKPPEPGEAKRYGTLVRVSDEFAEALRDAAGFAKLSQAEYVTNYLLPVVRKQYRDAVMRAAKKFEGKAE